MTEAIICTGLIPFLVNLRRSWRTSLSESKKHHVCEALIGLTEISSDAIGMCLILKIASQNIFPMLCSGDSSQANQTLLALQNLAPTRHRLHKLAGEGGRE